MKDFLESSSKLMWVALKLLNDCFEEWSLIFSFCKAKIWSGRLLFHYKGETQDMRDPSLPSTAKALSFRSKRAPDFGIKKYEITFCLYYKNCHGHSRRVILVLLLDSQPIGSTTRYQLCSEESEYKGPNLKLLRDFWIYLSGFISTFSQNRFVFCCFKIDLYSSKLFVSSY